MKIAILGTKGIPNHYGGFEQFSEFISTRLVKRGHSVTVYNPHFHAYKENTFNGVEIIRKYSPEKLLGGAANIIYDHLCLKDALEKDFDIIYEAGYHSVALSFKWFKIHARTRPVIITNMDGLEWKRSKWSKTAQNFIKKLEKIAVAESPYLISDNLGIQKYYEDEFNAKSFFIPYGADPVEKFDTTHLTSYGIKAMEYFILIARLEPENNIEPIIRGHLLSKSNFPLLIVGNHNTSYGKYLKDSFKSPQVKFLGGIYNKVQLDSIRHYSIAYYHGHSVGGTNPSLLEAMASQCFIVAHKNSFNESILGDSALYFENENDVSRLIENVQKIDSQKRESFIKENLNKIITTYNWEIIVQQHEDLFSSFLQNKIQ